MDRLPYSFGRLFGVCALVFGLCEMLPEPAMGTTRVNITLDIGTLGGLVKTGHLPDDTTYTASVFLGIPYAKAPVGDLRFSKPVAVPSLDPYFSADIESKACPQNALILKAWVPGPADMSEDCLKLNVYVPGNLSLQEAESSQSLSSKAVMVWFHGGAFLIGQSRIYNAERLATVGDVIVVTVNYRLGPLGFFSTGDGVVPGNAGLWDQHEAIKWIHKHITAFGGDPGRVTLFGESAGAASAIYQLMYPGNKDMFRRVISSSGTPLCPWGFSSKLAVSFAVDMAQRLGCGFNDYPGFSVTRHQKIVECLRTKSFEEIINSSFVGSVQDTLFRAEWTPVVDNDFITVHPQVLFWWSSGQPNNLPADADIMIGTDYDDGEVVAGITVQNYLKATIGYDFNSDDLDLNTVSNIYIPQVIMDCFDMAERNTDMEQMFQRVYLNSSNEAHQSQKQRALQSILDITTDYEFLMPAVQSISKLAGDTTSGAKRSRYLWQFDRKYPYVHRPYWLHHAAHGDDLPYIFGFPQSMSEAFNITASVERAEWMLSKTVMTYWTNFAKTGNPNTPVATAVVWPEFDLQARRYLYISANMTADNVKQDIFPERVKLWSQTLLDLYKQYLRSQIIGK